MKNLPTNYNEQKINKKAKEKKSKKLPSITTYNLKENYKGIWQVSYVVFPVISTRNTQLKIFMIAACIKKYIAKIGKQIKLLSFFTFVTENYYYSITKHPVYKIKVSTSHFV